MPFKTARIALTRAGTPMDCPDFGVKFIHKTLAGINGKGSLELVVMEPFAALLPPEDFTGPDVKYNTVMGGLIVKTSDGRSANGEPGLLVITQRRVIGMIDQGNSESGPLGLDGPGHVYCFSMSRADITGPKIKKRFMNASDFAFESTAQCNVAFTLKVYSAMVHIIGDDVRYWHDKNMIHAFSAATLPTD